MTGGAADLSEAAEDAQRMGIPALADVLRDSNEQESGFGVWRQNWTIVLAFLSVSSQWRAVGHGLGGVYWMGLDYAGARAGLVGAGFTLSVGEWNGLRTMERAARDALNGIRG